MYSRQVRSHFPAILAAVKELGCNVIWQCDPMHGNTFTATAGCADFKTRDFTVVFAELVETFKVHSTSKHGSRGLSSAASSVVHRLPGPRVHRSRGQ